MKLEIEYIPISEIKLYPNNAKIHTAEQIEQIKKSIQEFGFNDPIGIWHGECVEGHGRIIDATELGIETVPVIRLDELSDEQRRAYMLAHNQLTMNTDFDIDLLNMELDDITDINMEDFGLKADNDDDEIEIIEDEIPDVPDIAVAKRGQIWRLGDHYVMCGDSTNEEDVNRLMKEAKFKVMFASPPYNMNGGMYDEYKDNKESQEYIDFNLSAFKTWAKRCKGYIFWNISYNKNSRWEFIEILWRIVKETGMRFLELIVWDKGHGMPIVSKDMLTRQYEDVLLMADEDTAAKEIEMYYIGTTEGKAAFNKKKGKGISNYWRIGTGGTQLKNHKACNPVELSAKAIRLCSDRGDVVADCFGGSGTTLISAEQLGRKCYTMELEPAYVDVIIQRWENFTGKKAVLVQEADNEDKNEA